MNQSVSGKYNLRLRRTLHSLWIIAAALSAAWGVSLLFFRLGLPETNIVLIYMAAVIVASAFTSSYQADILASLAATLSFNFSFTKPYHSLSVDNHSYLITFAVMTVFSLLVTGLVGRLREHNERLRIMSRLLSRLEQCATPGDMAILLQQEAAAALRVPVSRIRLETQPPSAGSGSGQCRIPLSESGFPALVLEDRLVQSLSPARRHLLDTLCESTRLAVARRISQDEKKQALELAVREQERSSLLASISHDIRTPVTRMQLECDMMLEQLQSPSCTVQAAGIRSPEDMAAHVQNLKQEADRLLEMVQNILDLTRLSQKELVIHREWMPAEEPASIAADQFEHTHPGMRVNLQIPREPVMTSLDGVLMVQLLNNLLENSSRYQPGNIPIELRVEEDNGQVVYEVRNAGRPLAPGEETGIFLPSVSGESRKEHFGLGLAIVRAIASVHQGTIEAANAPAETDHPAGVRFTLRIPLDSHGQKGEGE